ncbi:MAG: 1,4-alpha-glucan branching protein GlgB [Propionibacteriaceae bacterium]
MTFDPTGGLSATDLNGFNAGHDTECWRRLGAHEVRLPDTARGELSGTRFSVWAPNARQVRVAGSFNGWDGEVSPMHPVGGSGVWSVFVEGVGTGTLYKFEVCGADGVWRLKADPMARFCEAAPHTASIVYESQYHWGDDEWLWYRGEAKPHAEPMSIYEVHLGSWRRGLTYLELADQLVDYVRWQGYTHVEFLPVSEHPFQGSWGYQVTGYFAPVSRFGSPDEFRHLVDRLHQAGIGVIVDWVPGHFPRDEWALGRFDGTALYEHADPRRGEQPDWGTYVFNFGRTEVQSFLISNAHYWLEEFHVDGLRVDAVASMLYLDYSRQPGMWIPNHYGGNENLEAVNLLQRVNSHVYKETPGVVTIAEESTSWPGVTRSVEHGGLGFGFKWNMGWMNDSLRYLGRRPVHRQFHHHEMTFASSYAWSENFVLPVSHDEVVHGKGSMYERVPEDPWRKFATLRAFYAFMWSHPGKQLIFMGTEFAQQREFSEERSLDWALTDTWGHRGVQRLVKDLNEVYRAHPALWELDNEPAGFQWIDADDHGGNVFSYLRRDTNGQLLAAVINFSAEPRADYRIGLPAEGTWTEILNTDAEVYDGTGSFGNLGAVESHEVPSHGYPCSAVVAIPPLGAAWFRHDPPAPDPELPESTAGATTVKGADGSSPKDTTPTGAGSDRTGDVSAAATPRRSRDTGEWAERAPERRGTGG